MIHFQGVTRSYGNRVAVRDLELSIAEGEVLALLGHNGAGKSTTLKMLVGLLRPSSGAVEVAGMDVTTHRREASRLIGYVPDEPFLYDKLSGREFLLFVADMYGLTSAERQQALERECQRFELGEFLDQLTESYSHGMRQRTVFAAALIHQPRILVVDEPMVGLDPFSIRLVKDLMRSYANDGNTVLMSTHTLSIVEEIADRVCVMKSGDVLFEGTMEKLRRNLPTAGQSLESLYLALMKG
jgi:ABC-2 type transport system ATP-binding protein